MIIMNLVLDNIRSFHQFQINFSYPRKIANSTIPNEHLDGYPNFRYKKANILMGSNATGKTTLGKTLMDIFNAIYRVDVSNLLASINNEDKDAYIEIDFIPNKNILNRLALKFIPTIMHNKKVYEVYAARKCTIIQPKDNYERCAQRLEIKESDFTSDLNNIFTQIEEFGWYFAYPQDNDFMVHISHLTHGTINFKRILENILMTLDSSIESIEENDIKNDTNEKAYSIRLNNCKKVPIIHDGEIIHGEVLSSGTKYGIKIAGLLTSIIQHQSGFYYCDELFSYIQTDIEKAILSLMISSLNGQEQLFFTTHNTDLLDMDLPKHAYTFMKKTVNNDSIFIEPIEASKYLKKGTESLRNAVENDMFGTIPNIDLIYELEDVNGDMHGK